MGGGERRLGPAVRTADGGAGPGDEVDDEHQGGGQRGVQHARTVERAVITSRSTRTNTTAVRPVVASA